MNGALETLVSQAYGFGNIQLCGIYLNRARIISTIVFIPIMFVFMHSEAILLKLGQDPITSHYAHRYIITTIPSMYFFALFDMQKRFLNCMQLTHVGMLATIISTLLHLPWCYYFVSVKELGVEGLGFAMCVTMFTQFIFTLIYSSCVERIRGAI